MFFFIQFSRSRLFTTRYNRQLLPFKMSIILEELIVTETLTIGWKMGFTMIQERYNVEHPPSLKQYSLLYLLYIWKIERYIRSVFLQYFAHKQNKKKFNHSLLVFGVE